MKPFRFLTSILAGISLGMLFAPKKGTDLRKKLAKSSDKMADFGEELLSMAEDASTEVKKFLRRKEVRQLVDSGKGKLQDLLDMAQEKGAELSSQAKKELQSLTANLEKKAKSAKNNVQKKISKKVKKMKKSLKK